MKTNTIICPGCGVKLPIKNVAASPNHNASGECQELFNELSGFTLSNNTKEFIHQYVVDAYGAQHAGLPAKNIRVAFSLIGLCLAVEHNYTGRQVQLVHMKIPKQIWPDLSPPALPAKITIWNVITATSDQEKFTVINEWTKSVWHSWSTYHEYIRNICMPYSRLF